MYCSKSSKRLFLRGGVGIACSRRDSSHCTVKTGESRNVGKEDICAASLQCAARI